MVARRYGEPPNGETGGSVSEDSVEQFRTKLTVIAARRLGNWASAQDAAQEALRRGVEAVRAGRIPTLSALSGFLVQTVVYVCLHHRRSAGREERALSRYAATPTPEAPGVFSHLVDEERRSAVRAAFAKLSDADQRVLSLTFVDELPTAEIAAKFNLTEGNVRIRRHRALKRLAELLDVTNQPDRE